VILEVELETFPQLETKNLVLRRMYATDAEAVFQIFADDEITTFYDLDTFTHIDQATKLIERQADRFERKEGIRWGIARKGDNLIIGTCGYVFVKPSFQAGLGYDLARSYWRQGLMTEALSAILRFGFERMELNRIQALVMLGNTASIHLLRKLRFEEEGILREYGFFKGKFHDLRCFSMLKKDYLG
jgi:[ribosomal protein S5]-alanine N-acetyltransferase